MVAARMLEIRATVKRAEKSKTGFAFHPFAWLAVMALLKIGRWRLKHWDTMDVDEKASTANMVSAFNGINIPDVPFPPWRPLTRIAFSNFRAALETARACVAQDTERSAQGWNRAVALDPMLAEEHARRAAAYDRTKVVLADLERVPRRRTR